MWTAEGRSLFAPGLLEFDSGPGNRQYRTVGRSHESSMGRQYGERPQRRPGTSQRENTITSGPSTRPAASKIEHLPRCRS